MSPSPDFEEIRPTLNQEPLLEGWRVYGKVVLEDGRFRRFSWIPRFTPEGTPLPEELEIAFGEGQVVRFRLEHEAFAVRFSQAIWKPGEPLEVRPIGFDTARHRLRFLLASGGEPKYRLEELTYEAGGTSVTGDGLIVEIETDARGEVWRRLAVLPVEAQLELWIESEAAFVRTRPPGLRVEVRILAEERLVQEASIESVGQGTPVAQAAIVPLRVEVSLEGRTQCCTLAPKGWPRTWWRLGLGLSSAAHKPAPPAAESQGNLP
ncbi:MAG: hypothetical protein RML45_05130 [Acetobacteraceae bacterium]|nr:hypothetical protein [Acetobacteraceae bacterium]